ncbi:glycosyl hydrolase family 18 protein [Sporosarcina highlanderae]|uniref:Glycosyl hydrolase family 18 protein n=1 Tax=Sporosarcina highlanderae TaxID=3035916 RepID=A0ABT8JTI3_9BACL|nr:glycosyl hydrolase family 18 protein [Sporosarcina highlanderae]MDN4608481.1 glycosyl hydrolase family 18 protein [Sporosarcina highlanderae]
MQIHVVKQGNSVWGISHQYGVTMDQIIEANQLENPNALVVGQALVIPTVSQSTVPKPVIDVNAYTINTGETGAREIQEVGQYLTYWMPFVYSVKEDGTLSTLDDTEMLKSAFAERVVPIMAITNFSATAAGSDTAHTILSSSELQEKVITNVLAVMKEKGYQGLNIDFENVYPADREHYNQFLQLAVDRLHPEGYSVSSALAPKTSSEQKGLLYEAHDYEAHGRIVDFVVLMTYEWGYRKGPAQAISPLNEIKKVLDYAVTVIPRDKILFGFQIYARDWILPFVQGSEAETFSSQEAVRRAIQHQVAIQYDQTAQAPFFRYVDSQGRTHEVWFEDARSAQAKFDMVKAYKLRGISYWVLGYPFPQNWLLLGDNFTIRKRVE